MKKHSLVIFDLGDHSPAGRARVVEYLSNRFEISPDIVGARLRDLPFLLRNWLDDSEISDVQVTLDELHCVFSIVENLGNVSDLKPPTPTARAASPSAAAAPAEAELSMPPTAPEVSDANAPSSAAPSVASEESSLLSFSLSEPTTEELSAVTEQLDILDKRSGVTAQQAPVERATVASPSGDLGLSFDEVTAPSAPTTSGGSAQEKPNGAAAPKVETSGSGLEFSFEATAQSAEQKPPAVAESPASQTPAASTMPSLDFDLSLSDEPQDIKPLVEEFEEKVATEPESFKLNAIDEAPPPPFVRGTASRPKASTPTPPAIPSPGGEQPDQSRSDTSTAAEIPISAGSDELPPEEFSEEEDVLLTQAAVPMVDATSQRSKTTFTLFHALGVFLIAVSGAFYLMLPKAGDSEPQLTLSEGSIDRLLKEQEQILNPVAGPARSISRWIGQEKANGFSTTVNLSLDLNQVMLNDIKGFASLEIAGSGSEPPGLTPEEIVARKAEPIWISRFEASLANFTPQEEQAGDLRKFEARGEARVYLKQGEKTNRLVSPIRVTGSLNLLEKRIIGQWELFHGTELPEPGTESFARNVANSFAFYFFAPLSAEPAAPSSSSVSSGTSKNSASSSAAPKM